MAAPRLLLFDHPIPSTRRLASALQEAGYTVDRAVTADDVAAVGEADFAVVLAEPGLDPEQVEAWLRDGRQPVILFEDFSGVPELLRTLAFDTIARPATEAEVLRSVERALEQNQLRDENRRLRHAPEETYRLGDLISRDDRMQRVFETVRSVADSRASLLIHGESGTGKTLLARNVHELSAQREQPFIVVNCGALPASLLESELFGHVRGAFTGAVSDRKGKFEAADGGTIFLDEIATASLDLQVKLLRVLEEGRFERVGESTTREVDVRLIAATNGDLTQEVAEGRFRADLFYRIHVVGIEVPPLRQRPGDVQLLAGLFLKRFNERHGRSVAEMETAALRQLCAHPWPGNVRELEHTIERAVLLARGDALGIGDLWPDEAHGEPGLAHGAGIAALPSDGGVSGVRGPQVAPDAAGTPRWQDIPMGPLKKALEVPERWLILRVLEAHAGNRQQTAKTLGINRTTLFNKMRKYHLLEFPTKMEREPRAIDGDSRPIDEGDPGLGKAG